MFSVKTRIENLLNNKKMYLIFLENEDRNTHFPDHISTRI